MSETYFQKGFGLKSAVGPVLAQSYADFELLVIDDGSSDGSAEVARALGDPRIRVEVHAQNLGIPATRNHGLRLARGEYLAVVDSDDVSLPERLALVQLKKHLAWYSTGLPGAAALRPRLFAATEAAEARALFWALWTA